MSCGSCLTAVWARVFLIMVYNCRLCKVMMSDT